MKTSEKRSTLADTNIYHDTMEGAKVHTRLHSLTDRPPKKLGTNIVMYKTAQNIRVCTYYDHVHVCREKKNTVF